MRGGLAAFGAGLLFLALAALPCAVGATDAKVPAWLQRAVASSTTLDTSGSDAVVLLAESVTEIGADGRRTVRLRGAVRVLTRAGREQAMAVVPYIAKSDEIEAFNAWLIDPGGSVRSFGQRDVVHFATAPESVYSEARTATINAGPAADAGSVFGWEVQKSELSFIGQGIWLFQMQVPVVASRITVRVPKGWTVEGRVRNTGPMEPTIVDGSYTWETRDLPAVFEEPYAARPEQRAAQLGYDVRAPAGKRVRSSLRSFAQWSDVVAYALELHDSKMRPDAAVAAKAHELCAAAASRWEKTRILCAYVRDIRYVAVTANLARGGGYVPHAPADVLRCGYGDCKDKATLLRALLAAEGIVAHPVLCLSGHTGAAFFEWPSPAQFDHVFVAIEVDDTVTSPFVVDDGKGGRLLLFDPTDSYTPVGGFPGYNQGAWVLICRPGENALTEVPVASPADNRTRCQLTAVVDSSGAAEVTIDDRCRGAPAAMLRGSRATSSSWNDEMAGWARRMSAQARLGQASIEDVLDSDGEVTLHMTFTAPRFARSLRGQLLVIPSVLDGRGVIPLLTERVRTAPIKLPAVDDEDVSVVQLPEGYGVAETVGALRLETDFGTYEVGSTVEDGRVVVRRSLVVEHATVPAARYAEVKAFFEAIHKSEASPIVVEKRKR